MRQAAKSAFKPSLAIKNSKPKEKKVPEPCLHSCKQTSASSETQSLLTNNVQTNFNKLRQRKRQCDLKAEAHVLVENSKGCNQIACKTDIDVSIVSVGQALSKEEELERDVKHFHNTRGS